MHAVRLMDGGIFQKIKLVIIFWLARRLPDCKQMTRSLGESLDRQPTWREKVVLKLHLFTCEACERYLEQVAFLKEAFQAHGDEDTRDFSSASLSADSKIRIKRYLRDSIGLAF